MQTFGVKFEGKTDIDISKQSKDNEQAKLFAFIFRENVVDYTSESLCNILNYLLVVKISEKNLSKLRILFNYVF